MLPSRGSLMLVYISATPFHNRCYGGRTKIDFLGDMSPKFWPPTPSIPLGDKKEKKAKLFALFL